MNVTPMMKQYQAAKAQCGDALLLFRMGDFYELFHDDARVAAEAVGLTLTSREKGANAVAMAGFPHHQLDAYLAKLLGLGYRVAVCDQVEEARLAKGLVKREITRVVTRGTLTDDGLLDPKEPNYLAAVVLAVPDSAAEKPYLGMAWVELSTGRFEAANLAHEDLADELARVRPAECLVDEEDMLLSEIVQNHCVVTRRPSWSFGAETARRRLYEQFRSPTMEGYGFTETDNAALSAAGAVLDYLRETQKASLEHIDRIVPYRNTDGLQIDGAARRSLELTCTIRDGRREGSLLAVLDRTVTASGARLLVDWLSVPLTDVHAIDRRLDAVAELVTNESLSNGVRESLRGVYDLQRLLARVVTRRATPRDLEGIAKTLRALPEMKTRLAQCQAVLLQELDGAIELCPDVADVLSRALVDGCPHSAVDGGVIRPGFDARLDELRELTKGGKQWIVQYQAEQQQRLGIPSLKVGFNQVFGYYLEITNVHQGKVPADFIRKQTLKNAERYITPELKEYEDRVLHAEARSKELELELFGQLRDLVQNASARLRRTADALAQLDVVAGLAELARRNGYCRPRLEESELLEIRDGRHPVLDELAPAGTVVPNDAVLGSSDGRIQLITGPNMAGKSTYIRQVALITVMAQMGSFVPARSARIGVVDRLFARVGASDELARGLSTFMVEMTETARILHTATSRSLVILDEIGRGTSTYDGISLAWAIVEYLHDRIGCRVLFATHYHELTDLQQPLPGVRNWNVAVRECNQDITFIYKISAGPADKSYGIHVARLAGIPSEVHRRASVILAELESDEELSGKGRKRSRPGRQRGPDVQLTLFENGEHPVLDEIRTYRVDESTPIDALKQIRGWQDALPPKSPAARRPR